MNADANTRVAFRDNPNPIHQVMPHAESPGIAARELTHFAIRAIHSELDALSEKFAQEELILLASTVTDAPMSPEERFFTWPFSLEARISDPINATYGVTPERIRALVQEVRSLTSTQQAALTVALERYRTMPEPRTFAGAGITPKYINRNPQKDEPETVLFVALETDTTPTRLISQAGTYQEAFERAKAWLTEHGHLHHTQPSKPISEYEHWEDLSHELGVHPRGSATINGEPVFTHGLVTWSVQRDTRDFSPNLQNFETWRGPQDAFGNKDEIIEEILHEMNNDFKVDDPNAQLFTYGDHPVTDQMLDEVGRSLNLKEHDLTFVIASRDSLRFIVAHPRLVRDLRQDPAPITDANTPT